MITTTFYYDFSIKVQTKAQLQKGFTLLEMVLVLFLVGLMASATLMLTENVEDQAKYDETKRRMEIMRKAIVGDPTRTVNGGPEINGFVADMGRLPGCVREILEPNYCVDASGALPAWTIDASTGIGSGWRGPYIQVLAEQDNALRFRDGYGNSDAFDAQNSGWKTVDVSGAELTLASDAFDLSSDADDVEAISPALIVANDWQINRLYINLINQNTSDALPSDALGSDINVRIYLSDPTDYVTGDDNVNTSLTIPVASIPSSSSKRYLFYFDNSNVIPMGMHSYTVVCSDGKVFKGNCSSGVELSLPQDLRTFTFIPRQTMSLDWVIQ